MFGSTPIYDILTSCMRSSYTPSCKTEISRMGENRSKPCLVCKNIQSRQHTIKTLIRFNLRTLGINGTFFTIWTKFLIHQSQFWYMYLPDKNVKNLNPKNEEMSQPMWKMYLSHRQLTRVQVSLCMQAVSPEPLLFALTIWGTRGSFRQRARHLALLDGCSCAFKG